MVRKRWLITLLGRRSAPREVAPFVAQQLLTMPTPLRACLGTAAASSLFAELTGHDSADAARACGASPAGRLPLMMLAPVATAYELQIAGSDDSRRSTWREDRYSHCPRAEAGAYLAFLAGLGYEMAPIEQAVADGTPYAGDDPDDEPLPPAPALPEPEPGSAEPDPDPTGEPAEEEPLAA